MLSILYFSISVLLNLQDDNTMKFLLLTMPKKNAAWFWKKINDSDTKTIVSMIYNRGTETDEDVNFLTLSILPNYVMIKITYIYSWEQ